MGLNFLTTIMQTTLEDWDVDEMDYRGYTPQGNISHNGIWRHQTKIRVTRNGNAAMSEFTLNQSQCLRDV